jgi:hypothetical protein
VIVSRQQAAALYGTSLLNPRSSGISLFTKVGLQFTRRALLALLRRASRRAEGPVGGELDQAVQLAPSSQAWFEVIRSIQLSYGVSGVILLRKTRVPHYSAFRTFCVLSAGKIQCIHRLDFLDCRAAAAQAEMIAHGPLKSGLRHTGKCLGSLLQRSLTA